MNAPDRQNEAAPVSVEQLRDALAFVTRQYGRAQDSTQNVFVWLWEAIQGDFNPERSLGQVAFDTAISIIPGVDQVCDVRDLIANGKQINEDKTNVWAWVGLGLTLIGLFPSLGSLVKGVLKIFFLFIRRSGGNAVMKAVDEAMTWVITFLRRRDVAKYWKTLKWDDLFGELARHVRQIREQMNLQALLKAFDRGMALLRNLLVKVSDIPVIGKRAADTVEMMARVRGDADEYLGKALKPLQDALDVIIRRLELEDLAQRSGLLNTRNVHFRGALPEARAVTLMRETKPRPKWLSEGDLEFKPLAPNAFKAEVEKACELGWPRLPDGDISTFAQGLAAIELKGPLRLYRVVGPGNMAAAKDWVSEAVFKRLQQAEDPKAAWRRHLAVWPDWNPDGQFVVFDLKPGESIKVWAGPASSQFKHRDLGMGELHLEGGYEQIKFDAALPRAQDGYRYEPRTGQLYDEMQYYEVDRRTGQMRATRLTRQEYNALPPHVKAHYESVRVRITNPRISGPFETGWSYSDFDAQLPDVTLGLPALPGQLTQLGTTP
ncbi:hypothetical protein ACFW0P_02795 [Lysobacter soli]|uniref:hypothetical protein n=1 Tax=Lysobacter soli TaxID=453783 RepID=UPI0036B67620